MWDLKQIQWAKYAFPLFLFFSCDPCRDSDPHCPYWAYLSFSILDSDQRSIFRDSSYSHLMDSIYAYSFNQRGEKLIYNGSFLSPPEDSIYSVWTTRRNLTLYIDKRHQFSYELDITLVDSDCCADKVVSEYSVQFKDSILNTREIYLTYP